MPPDLEQDEDRPREEGGPLVPGRRPEHLRRPPTAARVARFAAQWVRGTAAATLRYPFDVVPPSNRDEYPGPLTPRPDLARDLPGDPTTLQRAADGVGPLFHRRYWIDIAGADATPEQLIARLVADINEAAPDALGRFEDADGNGAVDLAVGDEVIVRLPGPWDGPVRVVDLTDRSFALATLDGHVEAGEIAFRATEASDGDHLRFEIESWARSSSRLLHALYDVVPLARELQLLMWARMCRTVVELADGDAVDDVQVVTERLEWDET